MKSLTIFFIVRTISNCCVCGITKVFCLIFACRCGCTFIRTGNICRGKSQRFAFFVNGNALSNVVYFVVDLATLGEQKEINLYDSKMRAQKKDETEKFNAQFPTKEIRDLNAGKDQTASVCAAISKSKSSRGVVEDDLTQSLNTSKLNKRSRGKSSVSKAPAPSQKKSKKEIDNAKKEDEEEDEDGNEDADENTRDREEEEEEDAEEVVEEEEEEEEEEDDEEGGERQEDEDDEEGLAEGEEGEEEFRTVSSTHGGENFAEESETAVASQKIASEKVLGALDTVTSDVLEWTTTFLGRVLKTTGKTQSDIDGQKFLEGLIESLRWLSLGKIQAKPNVVEFDDEEDAVVMEKLTFKLDGGPEISERPFVDLSADVSDDEAMEEDDQKSVAEQKEARAKSAWDVIGSVFAAFVQQREEVNKIEFPMGPPRKLTEEEKSMSISFLPGHADVSSVSIFSNHYQESILAKRDKWGAEGNRPSYSPILPENFEFRYLDDTSVLFAVQCYHAALGQPGCKSPMTRQQVVVTENTWYSSFTGFGKESHKMNEVEAKDRFDEFVRGKFHKYEHLLKKKQWHLVILGGRHYSLVVVFNTGSAWRPHTSDRCCVVSFDHAKCHDSAAHVNNICWFAFFPTDFFALLYSLFYDRFLYLLNKALYPHEQLPTFPEGKPQHVYYLPHREPPNQKDGVSCGDWMAMSAISCMRMAPPVSVANIANNFAVLKGSLMSQDFVSSHRQLLALLFFALNNDAFNWIDIEANLKIKAELDRILQLLTPPVFVDLTSSTPETIAEMLQRIETMSIDDGTEVDERKLKVFFHKKVRNETRFIFLQRRGMNMLSNCGFRLSSFSSPFHYIFILNNIRCPMNAALFCTAAALPTNYFASLSTLNLTDMDTLSYYLIRALICLRVSDAGADFLVDNTWLPSTPLALQLWEIAAGERELRDEGEHDLLRDVSVMMEILFYSDDMDPLVQGIFQPFVQLVCKDSSVTTRPYKLQDLVSDCSDRHNPLSKSFAAPLVSFEIGMDSSFDAKHSVFTSVFRGESYIRALGEREWVLESTKEFLEFLCKKGDKKTWQELAKYQTIASLFIKITRAARTATEALAGAADAAAEATTERQKGEEASSRAQTARRTATAAAEAAEAVLDLSFLEGYNDGADLVGSMWPEIDAFGIQLAVFIAMDRWSQVNDKEDRDRKLRDGILGNIPSELLQLHPERDSPMPLAEEATVQLSPQDAVRLLANMFLAEVQGKIQTDVVESLYGQARLKFQKPRFPLVCLPENLKVLYKDEFLDVVSAIDLQGTHFTTHVFSFNSEGGIQSSMYDDTRKTPRTRNINRERTVKNIVRVICARPSPGADSSRILLKAEAIPSVVEETHAESEGCVANDHEDMSSTGAIGGVVVDETHVESGGCAADADVVPLPTGN